MDSHKIVMHHVERNGGGMVFNLLGEAVGQASEAAHTHTHRKISAFDKTGADMFRIWISHNSMAFATDALSGAVPFLTFRSLPVNLHELRIVHVSAKRMLYRSQVCLQSVTRE